MSKTKNRKKKFQATAIAFWIMIGSIPQALAAEGGATSGGGGTHVCLKPNGQIKSAELYDLYEGREAFGLPMINYGQSTAIEILDRAMEKIWNNNPKLASMVMKKINYYVAHQVPKANKQFTVIKDANIVMVDKGCQYQQVAQWQDKYDAVFLDSDLFSIFSKSALNRAALALHEGVYSVARELYHVQDSDDSRKLVAQAFSNAPIDLTGTVFEKGEEGVAAVIVKPEDRLKFRIGHAKYIGNEAFEHQLRVDFITHEYGSESWDRNPYSSSLPISNDQTVSIDLPSQLVKEKVMVVDVSFPYKLTKSCERISSDISYTIVMESNIPEGLYPIPGSKGLMGKQMIPYDGPNASICVHKSFFSYYLALPYKLGANFKGIHL